MALALTVELAACAHESIEELGWGGQNAYLRCRTCGTVLIRSGDRTWWLRPTAAP